MQETAEINTAPRDLHSVAQFSERYPAFGQAGLRSYILNAAPRRNSRGEIVAGNGMEEMGVVVRVGRRVLIDEAAFFRWIAEQQKRNDGRRAA